jgi:hypothetical protein
VGQFAQQQPVERSAIRKVRYPSDSQFLVLGEAARQANRRHQIARGAGESGVFFVAHQVLQQSARLVRRAQLNFGSSGQCFEAGEQPKAQRFRGVRLESPGDQEQMSDLGDRPGVPCRGVQFGIQKGST